MRASFTGPTTRRRLLLGAAAFFVAGACGGAHADEPSAPPLYTETDLQFLHHMIVHHEQALTMSDLVPERTDRAGFIRFARYVKRLQAAEIAHMQSLLRMAEERGQDVHAHHHHPHGDPPMDGMLSSAQMQALAEASGAEFERLWLEGMIHHHQGAIDMAMAQQRHQRETGRRPWGIDVLVEEIILEQRAEIARMRAWLRDWDLTDAAG